MTAKRISAFIFLLLILAVPLSILAHPGQWENGEEHFSTQLETYFRDNFPLKEELSNLAWNIQYKAGQKELNGYYISTDGGIIKKVQQPDETVLRQNTGMMQSLAQQSDLPTYFMLIPTACAVLQQELPDYAFSIQYNQKSLIDRIYQDFKGELYTINVYPTLFANREKNLYFHTEDLPTSTGGYWIYTVLGEKLGGGVRPLDYFSIEYPKHDYMGSLAQKYPYASISPDTLALYHYTRYSRSYQVTHVEEWGQWILGDLYYRNSLESDSPLNVYLGGASPVTHIKVNGGSVQTKLLVIGDDTMGSYAPFLTNHYSDITLVNATTVTLDMLSNVDPYSYDQILFAFSVDTFMHEEGLSILTKLSL